MADSERVCEVVYAGVSGLVFDRPSNAKGYHAARVVLVRSTTPNGGDER